MLLLSISAIENDFIIRIEQKEKLKVFLIQHVQGSLSIEKINPFPFSNINRIFSTFRI